MWGFKNYKNRNLANDIYELVINKTLSVKYNPSGISSRGHDQFFLSHHVYNKIKLDSVIHDSFLCKSYGDAAPFPTKRIGNCFVGQVGVCNESASFFTCEKECRPKDHLDWETC